MTRDNYMLGRSRSVNFSNIILDTYSTMMKRYLQDKTLIPPGQLMEIRYESLIENPIDSMKKIYQNLNLGDFNYCEPAITANADKQKNYLTLKHDLPHDVQNIVSEKWKKFIEYYNFQSR